MAKDAPRTGEQTKRQAPMGWAAIVGGGLNFSPAPGGTYNTYRLMRAHPTIALARTVATAPVLGARWSVSANDNAPSGAAAFVDDQATWLWPQFIRDAILALDYGWAGWEKVFEIRNGQYWLAKLKSLRADPTRIMEDEHGRFAGLQQNGVTLPPEKALLLTYDGEAGNLYGRSRHENCRDNWHDWRQLAEKQGQYVTKVSGVIPVMEYPEGVSLDADGNEISNFQVATKLLARLGGGDGIAMPNTLAKFAEDLARNGVDIAQLKSWHISFLESKGSHGADFVAQMRHRESHLMRGWLVPERAATEGQSGTKAEAGEHGDIAVLVAEQFLGDIVRCFNWHVVDPLLAYNYGPEARGTVQIEREGMSDAERTFYRSLVAKVLGENTDLLLAWVDVDAMLETVGIPRATDGPVPIEGVKPDPPTDDGKPDDDGKPASRWGQIWKQVRPW